MKLNVMQTGHHDVIFQVCFDFSSELSAEKHREEIFVKKCKQDFISCFFIEHNKTRERQQDGAVL